MQTPDLHPEINELRQRCATLRAELTEVLKEWHRLSVVERPQLLSAYDTHFGMFEADRQAVAFKSAVLFRKIELLMVKISRGETITSQIVDLVNTVVEKEFERVASSEQRVASESSGVVNGELVPMYRTLAKKLHPDAVGEDPFLRSLWERVQTAYADKDAYQLQRLLELLVNENGQNQVTDTWGLERWRAEERKLSTRLRMEQRKLERLRTEEPFSIADEITDEVWIKQHTTDLEADLASHRAVYEERQKRYNELTANVLQSTDPTPDEKERQQFNNDFFDNTYFGGR